MFLEVSTLDETSKLTPETPLVDHLTSFIPFFVKWLLGNCFLAFAVQPRFRYDFISLFVLIIEEHTPGK